MELKPDSVIKLTGAVLLTSMLMACNSEENTPSTPAIATEETAEVATKPVTSQDDSEDVKAPIATLSPLTEVYLTQASLTFNATCSSADELHQATESFIKSPDEKALQTVQSAWLTSHKHYASTLLFRNIPINHPMLDSSSLNPVKHTLTVRIDQTPLLPGYIDEIEGYPNSGYVFSTLPIDRETINKEHQFTDTAYVAMGFHALEFLLWGEGNRSDTDFLPPQHSSKPNSAESFKVRRSQLLSLTTTILTEDLNTLCKAWQADTGFYATALKERAIEAQDEAIYLAAEQLVSELQISSAKIRQLTDDNQEAIDIEPHSAFSASDKEDTQAQINILKSLLDSSAWAHISKKQERAKELTQLAKSLLL